MAEFIRPSLVEFIKKCVPAFDEKGFICLDDLGSYRKDYVKEVLQDEIGELSTLDHEVIESLRQHEIVSSDLSKEFEVSPGRISQLRQEFHDDWLRFHGEEVPSRKRRAAC